jgi:hypothetical protein
MLIRTEYRIYGQNGPRRCKTVEFWERTAAVIGDCGTPQITDIPPGDRSLRDSSLEERVRCELVSEMGFPAPGKFEKHAHIGG